MVLSFYSCCINLKKIAQVLGTNIKKLRYCDFAELRIDGRNLMKLVTRKGLVVIIRSIHVDQMRNLIERYITGSGKVIYLFI